MRQSERRDVAGADALYKRSVEAYPSDPQALVDYADFLVEDKKDQDGAETLLKKAVQACPRDPGALCAYAAFLKDQRRDMDGAEKHFRMGVESAPYDADALCDLAHFLTEERRSVCPSTPAYGSTNHCGSGSAYASASRTARPRSQVSKLASTQTA